ncbi:MAG: hypothetical protein WBY94_04885 [Polyangiaceae bacterium]
MAHATNLFLASIVASLVTFPSGTARGDEAADIAAARILGGDGVNLADAGNCEQAIEKLERAEKLHHAPTTASRLGECQIETGRLVAGTETLQRVVRTPLPPNAPPVFLDSWMRARTVLERWLSKVPALRVSVRAPTGAKVRVTIDGDALPDVLLDNDRPTDPGPHKVVASAAGCLSTSKDITLGESETRSLAIDLEPDPHYSASQEDVPQRLPATARSAPHGGMSAAPAIAFVLGGLGLVAGAVSGVVVAVESADLSKICSSSKVCPQEKQSELNSARSWADVSTVGFGVAGAGLGAGILLLLTQTPESRTPPSQASLRPLVGPAYIGMAGLF